MIAVN